VINHPERFFLENSSYAISAGKYPSIILNNNSKKESLYVPLVRGFRGWIGFEKGTLTNTILVLRSVTFHISEIKTGINIQRSHSRSVPTRLA